MNANQSQPASNKNTNGTGNESPLPVQKPYNEKAYRGLRLSHLVPLLGLIVSVQALNESRRIGGSGRRMAIAGIIISSAYYAFIALSVIWLLVRN